MRASRRQMVRLAEPSDLPTLARLFEAWNLGPERGRESDLLNQLTLVVEREGRCSGCISALVGPSELAYIDNLVADPTYGTARLSYTLLTAMESLLARLGWSYIQTCVRLDRPELLAYAERLGYVDFGLHHVLGKHLPQGRHSHG